VHASTNESPYFLVFGRDPIFCIDQILDPNISQPTYLKDDGEFKEKLVNSLRKAWEAAAEQNRQAQLRAKEQYDKLVRQPTIKVGDRVLLRNYTGKPGSSKKYNFAWKGIFRVIEINGIYVTILSCSSPQSNPRVVHVNQLKKCFELAGPPCTSTEIPQDLEEALEAAQAEEIHDKPGYSHNIKGKSAATNIRPKEAEQQMPEPEMPIIRDAEDEHCGAEQRYGLRKNPKKKILHDYTE
jgi:hypothetical protein